MEDVGDWLRAGCTLPIIYALAWSMLTILRAECDSGQQERSSRCKEAKLVSPAWLQHASIEAAQHALKRVPCTRAEARSERPSRRRSAVGSVTGRGSPDARDNSGQGSSGQGSSGQGCWIAIHGDALNKRLALKTQQLERKQARSWHAERRNADDKLQHGVSDHASVPCKLTPSQPLVVSRNCTAENASKPLQQSFCRDSAHDSSKPRQQSPRRNQSCHRRHSPEAAPRPSQKICISSTQETLGAHGFPTLARERSRSDPFPTAATPAAKLAREHSAPAGLSFSPSFMELAQHSSFNELADLTCQRLNISRFELWRNKAVWSSLKQAWQMTECGRVTALDAVGLHTTQTATRESVHLVSDAIPEDGRAAREEVTEHLLARMRGAQPGAVWHVGGARRKSQPSNIPPPQREDASAPGPRAAGSCHASAAGGSGVRQTGAKQGAEGPRVITTPAFERLLQSRGAAAV
jgi:hypothetical protein